MVAMIIIIIIIIKKYLYDYMNIQKRVTTVI